MILSFDKLSNAQTTVRTYQNNTIILPCHIDNIGPSTFVQWRRDGILLADSNDPNLISPSHIKMWNNMSLEVSHIQPKDSGYYVCQISRSEPQGNIQQVYDIEVMYPPSIHSVPEAGELEVNLGDEVEMACITKGVPNPTISWRMKDEDMMLLDERSKLRFHADNRSMSGRYTCVANNGIGEPAMATIDLRIRYKPEIESSKSWIHASPGNRAVLDCQVSSWPEAHVDWYFQGEKIIDSSRFVRHTSGSIQFLGIRNVRATDYGYYLCRATNIIGTTDKIIELSGIANAAVFKESNSIASNAYNFIWQVDSYSPIIEYQFWFRKYSTLERGRDWHKLFIPSGGDAIGPLRTKSFNLTGLATATYYEALVLSRNRFGWSKPSKILRFATDGIPSHEEHHKVEVAYEESSPVVIVSGASPQSQSKPNYANSQMYSTNYLTLSIIIVIFLLNSLEHV
ncbi:hypothetical protein PV326_002203 [Microctonus aethiopoides]|uniref:Ig-like domain-containing protein n=1 Tax=Microctonus aethiopoides TaxID=144406 RepID=A0AA39FQN9_9HYME|nr:hypothetical protein PV326_002203 [Microctonus aethiopoides]KAK0174052.1 hypothetical protein PV328_007169 [Microctonus aethiopoides]